MKRIFAAIAAAVLLAGCGGTDRTERLTELFSITELEDGYRIFTYGTDGTAADSLDVTEPFSRIICMSSSYVAYLSELGCDSLICGIAGTAYISNPDVRERVRSGKTSDVGSDTMPDLEKIVSLSPDIVVAYMIPGSDFVKRLRGLGLNVLALNDYLENSPLSRAAYIRVFGALTGKMAAADSVLSSVSSAYNALAEKVNEACGSGNARPEVLMNIPYSDAWYIPGGDNYMSRLVHDAGASVAGAVPGKSESSVISVEQALEYSKEASFWLNTGWCDTMQELYGQDPVFQSMNIPHIYNNTRRKNGHGGNDFWESGAMHPERILEDLVKIMHPEIFPGDTSLYYYKEVK